MSKQPRPAEPPVTPAFPSGRPPWLGFLPRFLFSADQPKLAYIFKAWLLALLPSLALVGLVAAATDGPAGPEFALPGRLFVLLVVIVAPLLDTLLMIPPLWLLNRIGGPAFAAAGSALLWAGFHSLAAPLWGLVVWWPFLILSIAFLTWWKRGTASAILVVTSIHALQNAVAAALPFVLNQTM
jgi:hypothetical protein